MIISFRREFIFFPIPKTATHSIRKALRPHLGTLDWEQCILFEKKKFPLKELSSIKHGHISYNQLSIGFLPNVLKKYFKFCFVRHPLDRFISYCYFINRDNTTMLKNPLDTMKGIIANPQIIQKTLSQPQYKFVVDQEGKTQMDYVGKFECLQNDYNSICENVKIPSDKLSLINVSEDKKNVPIPDDELKEMVHQMYKIDYDLFGYDNM